MERFLSEWFSDNYITAGKAHVPKPRRLEWIKPIAWVGMATGVRRVCTCLRGVARVIGAPKCADSVDERDASVVIFSNSAGNFHLRSKPAEI